MHIDMKAKNSEDLKSLALGEATAQDIQMELIRRWQYNDFDGQRVADKLWAHRDLWQAVMMDRLALSGYGDLPAMGLIKLRDPPYDMWNVDTLYILAATKDAAEKLAEIFNGEQLGGMLSVHDDPKDIDNALGSGREKRVILSIWWD